MRLLCPLVGHLIATKGFEMRKLEDGDSEILIFVSGISLAVLPCAVVTALTLQTISQCHIYNDPHINHRFRVSQSLGISRFVGEWGRGIHPLFVPMPVPASAKVLAAPICF
jgi:hypothetical protein